MEQIFSVTEINSEITNLVNNSKMLQSIVIKGEISNITYHSTGHIYLTLKDEISEISGIIFSKNAVNLSVKLRSGLKVLACGSIRFYSQKGKCVFYIVNIKLEGVGDLFQQFNNLKLELEQQGWFDASYKKPIPPIPRRIGVISAATGAAVHDVIKTINLRFPSIEIYIFPCLVQGKDAPNSIINQIINANNYEKRLDTIILARGGGSMEDLWCFNNKLVAKSIFESKIPIITGIGHETDFTIADFVSDYRAATPTAAAEFATPDLKQWLLILKEYFIRLIKLIKIRVDDLNHKIISIKDNYYLKNPNWIYQEKLQMYKLIKNELYSQINYLIQNWSGELQSNFIKLQNIINSLVKSKQENYYNILSNLDLLSPLKTLSRGYTITLINQKQVKSIEELELLNNLETHFIDGTCISKILEVKKGHD